MSLVKVTRFGGGPVKLSEFMRRHGLELDMRERPATVQQPRWYVSFDRVEAIEGSMLSSGAGNGNSQLAALQDYLSRHVMGRRLVKNAFTSREEFDAPNAITIDVELES